MSNVMDVRRAVVKACVSNGITDAKEITLATIKAIEGLSNMTLAAYKAHATMRKNRKS